MSDLKRVTVVAVVLLVVLRMSIGWQFLYEGLWKLNSLNTAQPWSAEGYLKNAQGPFRNVFRNLTGDPDDTGWLDYENVCAEWDRWKNRFIAHYELNDHQKRELGRLLDGPEQFEAELKYLPEGVQFTHSLKNLVWYDDERKRLVLDGKRHLLPDERRALLQKVTVQKDPAPENRRKNDIAKLYQRAVNSLYRQSQSLSVKERLRASMVEYPHPLLLNGSFVLLGDEGGRERVVELYRESVERLRQREPIAVEGFRQEHLQKETKQLRELQAQLIGPIKQLDAQLREKAHGLLEPEQLAKGSLPETGRLATINRLTMWGLAILGVLLISGFGTRIAAVCGAGMLLSFYLAMPPWPGVPAAPGPEHSLFVNKNLIEVIALLGIAALPTGSWFGVDGVVRKLFRRRKETAGRQSAGRVESRPKNVETQTV